MSLLLGLELRHQGFETLDLAGGCVCGAELSRELGLERGDRLSVIGEHLDVGVGGHCVAPVLVCDV